MDTIEQTLRKAREVDQRFKAFMATKDERDKSMEQTMRKIKQTQQTLAKTKLTIKSIDNLYDSFEKRFDEAISSALKGVQKTMLLSVAEPNWKPNRINVKDFVQNIKKSKQIIVLTGAGMSVASGIPTFRGAEGFWDKQKFKNETLQNVRTPEQILTLSHFQQNQFSTWKWLTDFYQIKSKAKLNKGHANLNTILSQIVNNSKNGLLVTQNIDDFHGQAQRVHKQVSRVSNQYKICEIHGNINKLRCDSCSSAKNQVQFYDFKDYIKQIQSKQSPTCPKCSNGLRPHIMFFDEFYNQLYNQVQTVKNFSKQADLLIVIGTALQTGLARDIVDSSLNRNIVIMEINIEAEIKRANVMWLEGKADQVLDKIKYELWKTGL